MKASMGVEVQLHALLTAALKVSYKLHAQTGLAQAEEPVTYLI